MPGNSVQTSLMSAPKISSILLLVNSFLFVAMLAGPMIPGAVRYFSNTYLCLGIILLLSFLNYRLYKALSAVTAAGSGLISETGSWKLRTRILAWSALVPAVMLIGVGPITNPSAYAVDRFTRIFGGGVINDYSVSKKIHYFYFVLIIYGLLVFCFCQNIRFALVNNVHNKIRRLGEFADTLLFVGWSFLLVCAYRQFSNQYSYDLTLYLLKSFLIFMIPAFYLWETGKLKVHDVRVILALALFALVLSLNIAVCFDTRKFGRFSDILAIVLFASVLFFILNKAFAIFDSKVLYSKIIAISLIGSLSLAACSLVFEFTNIMALKTDRFIDAGKIFHMMFYSVCWLSLWWFCCVKKTVSGKTAARALFAFVLGVSLIISQPSLVIGGWVDVYESANYANPVSDFFNFGKIPLFENFPGHSLSYVISSIAYGYLTSDYRGANFSPWYGWLYSAIIVLVLYCFIKKIANGFAAVSAVFFMPYLIKFVSYYGIGLIAILPFMMYVRTLRKRYLALTVIISIFLVAYRLDIGFSFLVAMLCSSFVVRALYGRKILLGTVQYFAIGGAAAFLLSLAVCLIKDINPLFRIQQFLAIASSNDQWGYAWLGDTERSSYAFFYYALPVLSLLCFAAAVIFRKKFSAAQSAVLLCLLFAYYANLPRLLVRHSLAEYSDFLISLWIWTMLPALPFLLSRLFASRPAFILCQTSLVLAVAVLFNSTTFYDNSSLQNMISRAEGLSGQISPDARKRDISTVYNRGSRVTYDNGAEGVIYLNEIKAIADFLLSSDETFLDFTNQSTAYAWSGREDPVYPVQPPSMLSGEKSQVLFLRELEAKVNNVPIAIMPTDKSWYLNLQLDGINHNIRHYLVAEWIYNNYRPLIKYNDYSSIWVLNSRYDEFCNKLRKTADVAGLIHLPEGSAVKHQIRFIDWGYDNFVTLPLGAAPDAQYITIAHDYNVSFLPSIWGQFDSRNAASNADLAVVSQNSGVYAWDYSGKQSRPAYLRVDLSVSPDFLKSTNASTITLGNMEGGKFTPLARFRFRLKEGEKVYLFRISSDYYWSRGKLNALILDPNVGSKAGSVRILEGD